MATKRINYNLRIKAIRPYVSLKYKTKTTRPRHLTQKQKLRITLLYNEIAALKNRPYKISRPKDLKKFEAARQYSVQPKIKYLKVVFVPVGKGKVKIKFKKGKLYVEQDHVISTDIIFDQEKLALNPIEYVNEAIANSPAKAFNIMANQYEIPTGIGRDFLAT